MSIISQESIDALKASREKAKNSSSYQNGYHIACEALMSAVAQLEQLKVLTDSFQMSVTITTEGDKK